MQDIIIIGAGAIGRGYLPWVFDLAKTNLIFVDVNINIINAMRQQGFYYTFRARNGILESQKVIVRHAHLLNELKIEAYPNLSAVFMNVGPRNCLHASSFLRGVNVPVILCENDPDTVQVVKNSLHYDKVYFAIPDVITSNSASCTNLEIDSLAIHTEDGVLYIDERAKTFEGEVNFCSQEELDKQWAAKLYIHNTPHCIAAYLGKMAGVQYIHESMEIPQIRKVVSGAMNEMLTALKLRWDIPHGFLDWYAEKELQRFSNDLLCDPISRVAREPLRKLDIDGRLLGAAQICLSLGFVPQNILIGIVSALMYEDAVDEDKHIEFIRKTFGKSFIFTYILGLRKGEVLEMALQERYSKIVLDLEQMMKNLRQG